MRRVSDLPIKLKLTLISLLTTIVALVLAGACFMAYELVTFRKDLVADVSSVAEIVGYNSASALSFNDTASAEQTLRALSAKPHIVAACIYDHDGRVFATYPAGHSAADFAPPPPGATERFGTGQLDLYRPIAIAGENVGTIYLRTDLGIMRERLVRYAFILGAVMVGAILAALLIASQLQRVISAPVADLVAVANRVAVDKDYAIRAVKRGDDELGHLIDGFNEMLAQIQARDSSLRGARDDLEHRVEERTKELAQSLSLLNATLESTADGILVVTGKGRVAGYNAKFLEMWRLPREILAQGEEDQMLPFIVGQLSDGEAFRAKVRELYGKPEAESHDILEMKDGRVFERYSQPQRLNGICVGRVWSFRDITERKIAEAALEKANHELIDASRHAGMAEVATSVLHNVGNVLNSVGVSATLVANQIRHTKAGNVAKLAAMFDQHQTDLAEFLTKDVRGQMIPAYLASLAESLAAEQTTLIAELAHLRNNVEHIKEIVALQQTNARTPGTSEPAAIPDLLEEALYINADAFARYNVTTIRDYRAGPALTTDKHKVLQILINLVRNAKLACVDSARPDKQITVRTTSDDHRVKIAIVDNGVGIPTENLTRIFNHGFTTRKTGHGFALHSGALAAKELGGSLTVQSDGPGHGATFTLELPCQPDNPRP